MIRLNEKNFFFKRQCIEFRFLKNLHNDERGGIFSNAWGICSKTHLYQHHLFFLVAVLGLHCCAGFSLVAVLRLLTVVASPVAEHRL